MSQRTATQASVFQERLRYSVTPGWRGGWRVLKNYRHRALARYEEKTDAVRHAREEARKNGGKLVVHDKHGLIEHWRIYTRRAPAGASR